MTTGQDGTASADGNQSQTGDAAAAAAAATQNAAADAAAKGSAADATAKNPVLELLGADVDADTKDWVTKQADRVKDPLSLVKLAREQDKMIGEQAKKLGEAIRVPGDKATPEEIKAFKDKMGIPETPDGYEFKAPEKLPEGLPYDGERAKAFAAKAAELGLSKKQAQGLHDWVSENAVGDFNTSKEADNQRKVETAKEETAKLVKMYGPITGETFKANMAFADKALMEVGGQAALDAFQQAGLIGNEAGQKIIQNAAIADMLAKFGRAVYAEDKVLHGDPGKLNNPFADGDSFNLTAAMRMIKNEPQTALSFIAAAGKKPSDFGLKS